MVCGGAGYDNGEKIARKSVSYSNLRTVKLNEGRKGATRCMAACLLLDVQVGFAAQRRSCCGEMRSEVTERSPAMSCCIELFLWAHAQTYMAGSVRRGSVTQLVRDLLMAHAATADGFASYIWHADCT